ncbi:hypothetical protein R3I93_013161 [Phoxinus phoxinus]|uniref:non-specific serine/threonine protein kinase n=1 Tax=Phoxinus phoxinus TaxID=58324 RepID=A0AAN9H415_9TELE
MESPSMSYISLLNEYQRTANCIVEYEEGPTEGPSHDHTFTMRAIVNGQRFPDGIGKTKKEARQSAAKNALDGLKSSPNIESTTSPVQNISNNTNIPLRNYTCWLNEHSQKNRLLFKARETTKMDPGNAIQLCTYYCKYVCGEREFPEAYGNNKKEAKEAAAFRVYEELFKTQNTEVIDENSNKAQGSEVAACSASMDRLSLSIADDSRSSTTDHNYIAFLNEFCQKNKRVLHFKLVERRGPPHNPDFVYNKVVIDGKEYPEGQGKSLKQAKQHAAQRAWSELRDQSGWTTESSEDDISPQTQETSNSEDARLSSNSSCETPSSSDIVFKDSSAVSSPMAISPCVNLEPHSPGPARLDVKPKIKLAPTFLLSPNGLAQGKENVPKMNAQNLAKSSGDQPSNQAIKSRFLEDFDSISSIGKGGFGRVFKARRMLENKYYAVKIVKSRDKALREVGALSDFNNANIVRYYTAWEEDTAYRHESSETISDSSSGQGTKFLYIQMELCEGDTLRVWIDKRNSPKESFPERRADAARISRQVLTAVDYIHSKGLIHRDLKPPNIMFSSDGGVKVGDFGLVTAAEKDNDEQLLERTKRTGTRSYMSPEQATHTSYDKKVDIYALGLIYFELIYNLITAHEKKKIWEDIRRNRVFPPKFSKEFTFEHKLIDRMLSASPDDRPDATELIRELDQYFSVLKTDKDIKTF